MNKINSPQEFHADLVRQFDEHCENVRSGKARAYSFLEDQGIDYNGWIEHRHAWPVTEDLLCGPSLTSVDDPETDVCGLEIPFDECETCSTLVDMYRDYCSRERIKRQKQFDKDSEDE